MIHENYHYLLYHSTPEECEKSIRASAGRSLGLFYSRKAKNAEGYDACTKS